MTIDNFLRLSLDDRAALIWKRGKRVDSLRTPDFLFTLYQVEDFYIEFIVDDDHRILDVIPFRKGPRIEKYLNRISIENLLASL